MKKLQKTNKSNNLHFSLKDYINNSILNNEEIIIDLIVDNNSYFFTNKRIITFNEKYSSLDFNEIQSYFYDKISRVKYSNHLVNLDKYGLLEFNFSDSNKKLILNFPENIIYNITNIIDTLY